MTHAELMAECGRRYERDGWAAFDWLAQQVSDPTPTVYDENAPEDVPWPTVEVDIIWNGGRPVAVDEYPREV